MKYPFLLIFFAGVMTLFASCNRVVTAQSTGSVEKTFIHLKNQLDSAVNDADKDGLIKVKSGFENFTGHSEIAYLAYYYMACADYRLSSFFPEMADEQKKNI